MSYVVHTVNLAACHSKHLFPNDSKTIREGAERGVSRVHARGLEMLREQANDVGVGNAVNDVRDLNGPDIAAAR